MSPTPRQQALALIAAHRAELFEDDSGPGQFLGTVWTPPGQPCDVCGRGTALRETTDGEHWVHRCDVDSRVLTEVLASMLDEHASPGKMEP